VDKGSMLFAIPIIPECHHMEETKTGGQVSDRCDGNADIIFTYTLTVVYPAFIQELLNLQVGQ
jgi:hypothetical protein